MSWPQPPVVQRLPGILIDPERWYTLEELEGRGCSERTLRQEILERRLDAIYTTRWLVLGADLIAWAKERAARRVARAASTDAAADATGGRLHSSSPQNERRPT